LTAFILGYSAASVFVNIFSCNPIASSWRIELVPESTCINRPVFYFTQAALGILADIVTVAVPLPLLRKLNLPFKQKVAVGVLLTIGAL
jgi:hypothetical protein